MRIFHRYFFRNSELYLKSDFTPLWKPILCVECISRAFATMICLFFLCAVSYAKWDHLMSFWLLHSIFGILLIWVHLAFSKQLLCNWYLRNFCHVICPFSYPCNLNMGKSSPLNLILCLFLLCCIAFQFFCWVNNVLMSWLFQSYTFQV